MPKLKLITLGIWLFALILSALSLKFLPVPYIWIFLVWSLTFFCTIILSQGVTQKIFSFVLLTVFLILVIAEGYYAYRNYLLIHPYKYQNVYVIQGDPLMGYVPVPNTHRTAKKFFEGNLLYQAHISINSDGYRVFPPYVPAPNSKKQSLLFFGCSVTFGEGVNDEETMPYVTGTLTNGRYKIYNFAIHGYGPQHMLAAIDHHRIDSVVEIPPRYIIYQAVIDHVYRVAGLRDFVQWSPQYILGKTGDITYSGFLNSCDPSHQNCLLKRITHNLRKSYLYKRLIGNRITQKELDLFLKVVEQSRNLLAKKYPSAEFHVIFWHYPLNSVSEALLKGLKQKNFRIHSIQKIIPDLQKNEKLYRIPHDGHPTALAHKKVAQYVVQNIIHSAESRDDLENPSDMLTLNTSKELIN